MEKVIIRKAIIEDLSEIQKLCQALFIKEEKEYDDWFYSNWPYEEEGETYFKKELTEQNRTVFVAELDTKIIGYLASSSKIDKKYKNYPVLADINNIYILDEFRSQGIGSLLMEEFFNWCKEIKAKRATVMASYENLKGIDFYKQKGFKENSIELKINFKE